MITNEEYKSAKKIVDQYKREQKKNGAVLEKPLQRKCSDFFLSVCDEKNIGYVWGAADSKFLNQLIEKIEDSLSSKGGEITEDKTFKVFQIIISQMPEWYLKNSFDIKTITSKYNAIVNQIKGARASESSAQRADRAFDSFAKKRG